jgi:uncharacterized protein (DUF433 family)
MLCCLRGIEGIDVDELLKRIVMNPKVMVGKPVIKGTRITVEHIMRELAGGLTPAEIVDAHPRLTPDDVRAACAYAAARFAEERITLTVEP